QHSRIDFDLNVCWEDQSSCGWSLQTPKNPKYSKCSYNVPIPCPDLEIHPEVLATIEDRKEGSDNEKQFDHEEQSEHDIEYLSDPDLDDIPEDIDDEGPIE
ncbi:hypothetical protein J1N35_005746, partial [Gossypium stocksii]